MSKAKAGGSSGKNIHNNAGQSSGVKRFGGVVFPLEKF